MDQNENVVPAGLEQIQEQIYKIRDYLVQLNRFYAADEYRQLPIELQNYIAEAAEQWETDQWNRLRELMLKYSDLGYFDI